MSRRLAATLVGAVLAGCAAVPADPRTIGDRQSLCAGRVAAPLAERVTGGSVAALRELNELTPAAMTGGCTLEGPTGAVLDVEVVADPRGEQLERELAELITQANYRGEALFAVAGEGPDVTAVAAVDGAHYVRVRAHAGSTEGQREAALALAQAVALTTAAIG